MTETMNSVRSVKEISEKFPDFEYRQELSAMKCLVCGETFKYSSNLNQSFETCKMGSEFSNLKRHLKDHLSSGLHTSQAQSDEAAKLIWEKEEGRNKQVGLRLGRLVYFLIYHGRPHDDYTQLVYISVANGSDCGDINHSKKFVDFFLPYLATAERGRLKALLSTRMEATGCLPPVNIFADKATHQRNTRQLVGVITLNPGGQDLLVALLLGLPLCSKGDGSSLCTNIEDVTKAYVNDEQVKCFTGNGVYAHTKVAEILSQRQVRGRPVEFTRDYMHKVSVLTYINFLSARY